MTQKRVLVLVFGVFFICLGTIFIHGVADAAFDEKIIVDNIEKRYAGAGFSAQFSQTATISAIDVADTAEGIIFVKRPGKMRWEYEKPQPQLIVTDGNTLWVYRPDEKQVMMGNAPDYFGEGKGIGFLSDIGMLKRNFVILRVDDGKSDLFRLKLLPHKPIPDMADIYIYVSKNDYYIVRITTYNQYGDETIINLHNIRLDQKLDDGMFQFVVPDETEVLQLTPNE